ncbi:MAG: hypothetical protein ABEJ31_11535 [Haloarculaceae archaeon]
MPSRSTLAIAATLGLAFVFAAVAITTGFADRRPVATAVLVLAGSYFLPQLVLAATDRTVAARNRVLFGAGLTALLGLPIALEGRPLVQGGVAFVGLTLLILAGVSTARAGYRESIAERDSTAE